MKNGRKGFVWWAVTLALGILCLAGVMAVVLAARGRPAGWARDGRCSPEHPAARGPEYVFAGRPKGQRSPRQVLEKFHNGLVTNNLSECLQCVRGTSAELCHECSRRTSEMSVEALHAALVKRFGAAGWRKFYGLLRPCVQEKPAYRVPGGRTIPKLRFRYEGNLAEYVGDRECGVVTPTWFSRYHGFWYIDITRTHFAFRNRDFCPFTAWEAEETLWATRAADAVSAGKMGIRQAAAYMNRALGQQ